MAQKIDLLKSVARNINDLIIDGVPASLTGSSVDNQNLIFPLAQQMQGFCFYIYSGAGAGQERIVGSFVPANNRMIFPQIFGSIPSTNSNFIVLQRFRKQDYDNSIERYMGMARLKNLIERVATASIVGTQYEYAVPSGFEYVNTLRLVPTSGTDYDADSDVDSVFEIRSNIWRIERNVGGSYVIAIDSRKLTLSELDGCMIKIMGQTKPDTLGTDNAEVPAQLEEYLIAGASMQMASLLPATNVGANIRLHPKYYQYRDDLNGRGSPGLEDYIFSHIRGKKVG